MSNFHTESVIQCAHLLNSYSSGTGIETSGELVPLHLQPGVIATALGVVGTYGGALLGPGPGFRTALVFAAATVCHGLLVTETALDRPLH